MYIFIVHTSIFTYYLKTDLLRLLRIKKQNFKRSKTGYGDREIRLPCSKILPFSGKIFFHRSENGLILSVYRQKFFSQLLVAVKI